jgi:hypothetical protein
LFTRNPEAYFLLILYRRPVQPCHVKRRAIHSLLYSCPSIRLSSHPIHQSGIYPTIQRKASASFPFFFVD